MACWVVPSIAAEFWRVPLDHVMDQIRRNAIPVKHENGFTFVDVLPDPVPQAVSPEERPATYVSSDPIPLPVAEERSNPRPEINPDWVSHNPAWLHTATSRRAPARAA